MKIPLTLFALGAVTSLGFAETYRVALITDDTSNIFWRQVYTGAAKACAESKAKGTNVELSWDGPVNDDDEKAERRLLQEKIDQKVDGIVLSPTADVPEIFEAVATAAAAGIPTVVINAGLRSVGQVSFVATNNYKGGTLAARKMGGLLKGRGKVVVFRWMAGNSASGNRETGFINVIKGQYPGIQIVSDDEYAKGNYASAQKTAAEIVKRFGADLDGIFTPTEVTTETMLLALRAAGVPKGKLVLLGFDSNELLVKALEQGEISGLVVQNPVNMGYEGITTLLTHLHHQPVDREVDTGCTMVTTDNLADPAIQQIINPTVATYQPKAK